MATSSAAFMAALRIKRIDVRPKRAPGSRRGGLVHARARWEAKEEVGQLPAKVAWSKPFVGAAWLVAAACAWATWSWIVQPAKDAWKQAGGWKPMAQAARMFVQEETKLGKALEWPTAKEASRDTLLVLVCAAALVVFLCTVDSFWVKNIVGYLRKRSGMPS